MILEIVEAYDQFNWGGKGDAVFRMIGMVVALSVAINLASRGIKAGASASGLAMTILAMVISLKIIVSAIKDFSELSDDEFKRGGAAVAAVLGFMTVLMAVANLTNKGIVLEKGQKAVNNFTGFAVALLAVIAALWILGKMALDHEDVLIKGGTVVAATLATFTAMFTSIGLACSGLKMGSIWSMIAGIVVVIAALSGAIYLLRDVPWQTSIGVAGAMALVIVAMGAALKTLVKYDVYSGNIWHWVAAMGALAVIAGLIAFVLYNAKDISAGNALGVAGGISIMLAAMAGSLLTLSQFKVESKDIWKWIPALAVMTVVVGLLAFVLRNMNGIDSNGAVGNAAALSILLVALTGTMAVLTAMSKFANPTGMLAGIIGIGLLGAVVWELGEVLNAMKTYDLGNMMDDVAVLSVMLAVLTGVMAALTGLGTILSGGGTFLPAAGAAAALVGIGLLGLIIWELGGILNAMKSYGLGDMMPDVLVLSALLIVLTGVMAALSVFGMLSAGAFGGIVGLAALGLVVWELGAILNAMRNYKLGEMMPDVKVLSKLLITLTGVLAALALIGILGIPALVGVVGIAALGLVVWELGAILNAMKTYDLSTAMPMVTALVTLIEGLTDVLVKLAIVGPLAAVGVIALQGLLLVVMELAGFVGAIGFLMDKIPSLENFLDKGIGVFVKLAGGLGEIIGAFAGGIVSSITEPLVDLAEGLSDFATKITGFVDVMSDIDPNVATGVDAICKAILALTGANLLEGISTLFGGKDLATFGQSIADFAECIKNAAGSLKDITDDDVANIERAAKAGTSLSNLAQSIPRSGGVWQEWIGEKNMSQFGQTLVDFGDCIVKYSKKVSGEDFDAEAIKTSAEAGKALTDVAQAIPASGGLWQEWIAGEKNLSEFGKTLVDFGGCLVDYNALVTGKDFDAEAIKASAGAGAALAEVANAIPASGGIWNEWISGEHDLADFGNQLITFGEGILAYSAVADQITEEKIAAITNSGKAIDEIKTVMEKVPAKANWWDNLWGNNQDGGTFGAAITVVANGINRFCAVAVEIKDKTDSITNVGTAIDNINDALGKIPDDETIGKATTMSTAVTSLKSIALTIHSLTAAEYDYSGLTTFRTAITYIKNMFAGMDLDGLVEKYRNMYAASTHISKIAKEIAKVNNYTYEGVTRFRTMLKSLGSTDVDSVITAFQGKSDDIKTAVGGFIKAMGSAIDNNADHVTLRMEGLMNAAVKGAKNKTDEFGPIGSDMAKKLGKGIEGSQSSVYTAGENAAAEGASGAKQGYRGMYNAGAYLVSGFVSGIDDNDYKAAAQAKAMAQAAVTAARVALAINSPSKVFRAIGYSIPEGFAMGIDRMSWMVKDSTVAMGTVANKSLSSTISRISDAISTDIDAQPTIRPVLDLSDVRSGAGMIGSLLGGDASVGVLSNVSGISTMMNRRSQNSSNADVVSAIDKLNRKMDNLGNTTYQINGITYDDGSNINDAVAKLVRAARIERRV